MKKIKAFTLVEVVIAITVVSVTIVAVYGLIISVLNANQRNLHNLQASSLAAEGLEAFRFMRDSNWIGNYSWDRGFDDVSLTYYLKESESKPYWELSTDDTDILVPDSIYSRKFEIAETVTEKTIQVTCTVSWDERGIPKSYALSTFLSDWHE